MTRLCPVYLSILPDFFSGPLIWQHFEPLPLTQPPPIADAFAATRLTTQAKRLTPWLVDDLPPSPLCMLNPCCCGLQALRCKLPIVLRWQMGAGRRRRRRRRPASPQRFNRAEFARNSSRTRYLVLLRAKSTPFKVLHLPRPPTPGPLPCFDSCRLQLTLLHHHTRWEARELLLPAAPAHRGSRSPRRWPCARKALASSTSGQEAR